MHPPGVISQDRTVFGSVSSLWLPCTRLGGSPARLTGCTPLVRKLPRGWLVPGSNYPRQSLVGSGFLWLSLRQVTCGRISGGAEGCQVEASV